MYDAAVYTMQPIRSGCGRKPKIDRISSVGCNTSRVASRSFRLRLGGLRLRLEVDGDARLLRLLRVLNLSEGKGRAIPDLRLTWTGARGELHHDGRLVYQSRSREGLVQGGG